MPCEAAAAALLGLLDGVICVGQKIEQTTENIDSIVKQIRVRIGSPNMLVNVLLLGTYWKQAAIEHAQAAYPPLAHIVVYSDAKLGPAAFVFDYAKQVGIATNLFRIAVQTTYAEAVRMIDDRFLGKNIVENQVFFTGLFNHASFEQGMSTFDRFTKFFNGAVPMNDLIKAGVIIVDSQLALCLERAEKNSRMVKLESGQFATVTNGSDLINLTHEALHKKTGTPVTIVVTLKFSNSSADTEIAYSIRSYDEKISAVDLIAKLPVTDASKAGGNAQAAGGRVPLSVMLNF